MSAGIILRRSCVGMRFSLPLLDFRYLVTSFSRVQHPGENASQSHAYALSKQLHVNCTNILTGLCTLNPPEVVVRGNTKSVCYTVHLIQAGFARKEGRSSQHFRENAACCPYVDCGVVPCVLENRRPTVHEALTTKPRQTSRSTTQ